MDCRRGTNSYSEFNERARPDTSNTHQSPDSSSTASTPCIQFDAAEWASYVAEFDMDESQKAELLRTLWDILGMFADAGFGIEPTQQACGQNSLLPNLKPDDQDDPINLKSQFKHNSYEPEGGE